MEIGTAHGFCSETAELFQFIGQGVSLLKILIPVVLIIVGIVSFGKAVLSSEEKDMKTAINTLIKKLILSVVIVFLPQIISGVFSSINKFNEVEADYNICIQCITDPSKCPVK